LSSPAFLSPLFVYDQQKTTPEQGFFPRAQLFDGVDVEIGFGLGEFLVRQACAHSNRYFIGVEQIWERIYKTLKRIQRAQPYPNNISLVALDATVLFEWLIAPRTIDRIYCLFPCPWPKKKHIKHRLFSRNFLKLLNNRLRLNGTIQLVTDDEAYFQWVREETKEVGFEVETRMVGPRFATKFERKWTCAGQEMFFEMVMTKRDHQEVAIKKGEPVKAYTIDKRFNPQGMTFRDVVGGEITLVFKQWLFDARYQRGEALILVAEPGMEQYVRVAVIKKEEGWRICRARGQRFFPTDGVARAIEEVYRQIATEAGQEG